MIKWVEYPERRLGEKEVVVVSNNYKYWKIKHESPSGYALLDVEGDIKVIGYFPTLDAAKLAAEMIRG